MEIINFKINTKIEFILPMGAIGTSLIQEVDSDFVYFTIPLVKNRPKALTFGEPIEVIYSYNGGQFGFTSTIVDKKADNIILYKMMKPKEFYRIQRRNFVRMTTNFHIQYLKNTTLEDIDYKKMGIYQLEQQWKDDLKEGYSLDLSGGGIKLSIKEALKEDDVILVLLKHPALQIAVKGRVIRCLPSIFQRQVLYHVGIEFIDIPDSLREKIIQLIFVIMREMRKKD